MVKRKSAKNAFFSRKEAALDPFVTVREYGPGEKIGRRKQQTEA